MLIAAAVGHISGTSPRDLSRTDENRRDLSRRSDRVRCVRHDPRDACTGSGLQANSRTCCADLRAPALCVQTNSNLSTLATTIPSSQADSSTRAHGDGGQGTQPPPGRCRERHDDLRGDEGRGLYLRRPLDDAVPAFTLSACLLAVSRNPGRSACPGETDAQT